MTKWLAMLVSCLALGLVIAACGDDDEDSGDSGADTEAPAPESGKDKESATAGKATAVTIKDFAFDPATLEVEKGTAITWTNEDEAGHDVTKTGGPGPEFSSGAPGGLAKGDTYKETLTASGEIEYVCTVHPNMKATLTVK